MLFILIGYILVHFHINIDSFDLLPNFLGFIFVFIGLGQLQNESLSFEKGRPWALGLAIVHFIFLFPLPLPSLIYSVVNLILLAASIYLLYLICTGVQELEQSRGQELGSAKMLTVWKVHAVCNLAAVLLSFFMVELLTLVALVLGVAALVTLVILLVYFYRCHKALQQPLASTPSSDSPTWHE